MHGRKNRLKVSEPKFAGVDENNWSVSFLGGYAVLNAANTIVKNRLKYSLVRNGFETYLAIFKTSGSGFKIFRGGLIGDE